MVPRSLGGGGGGGGDVRLLRGGGGGDGRRLLGGGGMVRASIGEGGGWYEAANYSLELQGDVVLAKWSAHGTKLLKVFYFPTPLNGFSCKCL